MRQRLTPLGQLIHMQTILLLTEMLTEVEDLPLQTDREKKRLVRNTLGLLTALVLRR